LRDIARNISLGIRIKKPIKTVIIDERSEIAGASNWHYEFDVGLCDVMNAFPKSIGIEMAVRCLSPECIICDEIGTENDLEELINCANCGVKLIASVHAKDKEDFFKKNISQTLISKCGFENLVFLRSSENAGEIHQIIKASEF
jgi:stage III sporulation protein AA